jgi:hypothetical protein
MGGRDRAPRLPRAHARQLGQDVARGGVLDGERAPVVGSRPLAREVGGVAQQRAVREAGTVGAHHAANPTTGSSLVQDRSSMIALHFARALV